MYRYTKLIQMGEKYITMNNYEMKKYGPIIKYFNPNAKFR